MKLVVSQQIIKCESTRVDAAYVLSFLVSKDAGFITADSVRGRRFQSKLGHRIQVVVDATCPYCR
jgi:hypothetical protein